MGDSVVWSIECDVWLFSYYGSLDRVPERGYQLSTDEQGIKRRTFISRILHAAALRRWKTYKAHRPSADCRMKNNRKDFRYTLSRTLGLLSFRLLTIVRRIIYWP
jgi:hypothetical protein